MSNPVIVVIGAGPGVSGSVARRFAREGYDAELIGVEEAALTEPPAPSRSSASRPGGTWST